MSNDSEDPPKAEPNAPLLPRRERRRLSKVNGHGFVPLAPPPVDEPAKPSEQEKLEAALLDMLDSMNALTVDGKPEWFILGPYIFHAGGGIYYHNGNPLVDKWTLCNEAQADTARAYLKERMNPGKKRPMP